MFLREAVLMHLRRFHTSFSSFGYAFLTGKALTPTMAGFSRSFTRFAIQLCMAKATVMAANLCLARYLDTKQFGELALVLAIGSYWCLPFFTCWGFSYVRFASRKDPVESCEKYLGATLVCVGLAVGLLFPILVFFRQEFSNALNLSIGTWLWGCFFGILMGAYYFSKNIFQAAREWNLYVASEFLFSLSLILGALILYLLINADQYPFTLYLLVFAHICGLVIGTKHIVNKIQWFTFDHFKQISIYGIGLCISFGLSLLGLQLDKILLNYYSDMNTVGRYQAYYISTYGILSGFSIILNNYLLPAYGQYGIKSVQRVLQRVLILSTLPLFAGCLVAGRLAFHLLGHSYGFLWSELLWASVFSVAAFWLQTEVFFAMTLGRKQLAVNSLAYALFIAVQCLTMPYLIRTHGVMGAYQGMTAASLGGLLVVLSAVAIAIKEEEVHTHEIQRR